jgi:hypothetical protein
MIRQIAIKHVYPAGIKACGYFQLPPDGRIFYPLCLYPGIDYQLKEKLMRRLIN